MSKAELNKCGHTRACTQLQNVTFNGNHIENHQVLEYQPINPSIHTCLQIHTKDDMTSLTLITDILVPDHSQYDSL